MAWTTGEANEIREILKMVTETATELPVIREEVADHRLMLNGPPGNGTRPGLRSRVDSHDDRIDGHDGEIATIQQKYRTTTIWAWRVGGGLIVSIVGTFIVWALN